MTRKTRCEVRCFLVKFASLGDYALMERDRIPAWASIKQTRGKGVGGERAGKSVEQRDKSHSERAFSVCIVLEGGIPR